MGNMNLVKKHLNTWRKFENRTICYIMGSSRLYTLYHQLLSNKRVWNLEINAPLSLPSCFRVNLGQSCKAERDEMLASSYASFISWSASSFQLCHPHGYRSDLQAQMWGWKGQKKHANSVSASSSLWILTSSPVFSSVSPPTSHSRLLHAMYSRALSKNRWEENLNSELKWG